MDREKRKKVDFENCKLFDLKIDGKDFWECNYSKIQTKTEDKIITVYQTSGVKITNTLYYRSFGAVEWVNEFENVSDKNSPILSDICDCSATFQISHEDKPTWSAYLPNVETSTRLYAPVGSTWNIFEFKSDVGNVIQDGYSGIIKTGEKKRYTACGGRSSDKQAPFFNIHKNGEGYIFAIGWSGQWACEIERNEDSITFVSGVENTKFYLLPGEKVRTSSVVILPYNGTVEDSQNLWRKLVKQDYSPIGKNGCDDHLPLCVGIWGGMTSKSMIERINKVKEADLGAEYVWMDAGWYGMSDKESPDEFEGDWSAWTGDWRINPYHHPDKMKDVVKAIRDNGFKFILWFEPQRVVSGMPIINEHPEYFLTAKYDDGKLSSNYLLNLGREDAWKYCVDTVSGIIEELGVDCYREDFNFEPLKYWKSADTENRIGITEIKHINGFYKFWDALRERFPGLLIDNCASGGRRIDIETLRRSVPLWRSDALCPANFDPKIAQCHELTFPSWMPYSGTGSGRAYDTYRVRSCYASGLTTNYTFSERDKFGDDEQKIKWIRTRFAEYKRVREYLSEDFYSLTDACDSSECWSAMQYVKGDDGMIRVFRRDRSPYVTAAFDLRRIDENAVYELEDVDGGKTMIDGKDLARFTVTVNEKPCAKIYFYKKK